MYGIEIENIASLDEKISLTGFTGVPKYKWETTISWRDLFALIAPYFLEPLNDYLARKTISEALVEDIQGRKPLSPDISSKDFQTIKIQMNVLELIRIAPAQITTGGQALFWRLSQKGIKLMNDLRVIRHSDSSEQNAPNN